MTTTEVCIFTKDMWYGYAGCEKWLEGDADSMQPIHRDVESCGATWTFIADRQTVQAFSEDGEVVWGLNVAFPTQEAAKAFLRGIEEDFSLAELGFMQIY